MAIVDFSSLVDSGSVTRVTAEVAAIDFFFRPTLLRFRYRTVTGGMIPQVDLIFRFRHVGATVGFIMNFMIAIRLLIVVDDVLRHNFRLM